MTLMLFGCAQTDSNITFGPGDGITGVAGSTSRFIVKNGYLYIATDTRLKVIAINAKDGGEEVASVASPEDLETLFSYGDYLFLGGSGSVQVYSIQDPASPNYLTRYYHQTGCDPVIATQNFAYLTIRDGATCSNRGGNMLITLDISDINDPVATDTIDMIRPRGLAMFDGSLYVGEGIYGLKKFDLTVPHHPALDTFYQEIPTNDLIGLESQLIITANDGVSQYELEENMLNLISTIQ